MKKFAGIALLSSLIILAGCDDDANEVKESAKKTGTQVQEKLDETWREVKKKTHELKNDESLNALLKESKAMGLDIFDDGKDFAIDAWIKSKEATGELTEKTKQQAREIAEKIELARKNKES